MSSDINVNLENVVKNLLPEAIQRGLERACQIIENESKEKCPVDTGTLRASITHTVSKEKGRIGTNVEYAPPVHERKPFLQDAVDENMDKILDCFKNQLEGGNNND